MEEDVTLALKHLIEVTTEISWAWNVLCWKSFNFKFNFSRDMGLFSLLLISNLFHFGQRTQDFNNFNYIETWLMTQNTVWVYFLFWDTLFKEMSFLCLWGLYFLKWDVNKNSYLWSSMYNVSFSPGSGCFYHYLFITGFYWFDYMSWCGFLCVYFVWACWASWICEFIVHNKFWKILAIISKYFFCPFSLLCLGL